MNDSFKNRPILSKSALCGCYNCISIFSPAMIKNWVDNSQTALCPKCYVDQIVPLKSGTAKDFEQLLIKLREKR